MRHAKGIEPKMYGIHHVFAHAKPHYSIGVAIFVASTQKVIAFFQPKDAAVKGFMSGKSVHKKSMFLSKRPKSLNILANIGIKKEY
jgi:hypothetical protein